MSSWFKSYPSQNSCSLTVEYVSHKYAGKGSSPFLSHIKNKNHATIRFTFICYLKLFCLFFFYFFLYVHFFEIFSIHQLLQMFYIRNSIMRKNYAKAVATLNEKPNINSINFKRVSSIKNKITDVIY
jgi:hypothetical protein